MKFINKKTVEYFILFLVILGLIWVFIDWRKSSEKSKNKGIIIAPIDNKPVEK